MILTPVITSSVTVIVASAPVPVPVNDFNGTALVLSNRYPEPPDTIWIFEVPVADIGAPLPSMIPVVSWSSGVVVTFVPLSVVTFLPTG